MKKEEILAELKVAKERIEFLESELNKPEKFEFKYIESKTYCIFSDEVYSDYEGDCYDNLKNFRYRKTETNAKADFQLQKELMCIGALAEQIDPNYKSKIYFTCDNPKYTIFYNYSNKTYVIGSNREWKCLGAVYMPLDVAEKVCEILNNKGVEL